jgi:hypothetical protein
MAEELNDQERRETELWQVLDWSLWGNGLGDVLREAIADKAVAALTDEQREQAEACIKQWHILRGPSMAVGEGTELQRQRDLLLWLHAEAVWRQEELRRQLASAVTMVKTCTGHPDAGRPSHFDLIDRARSSRQAWAEEAMRLEMLGPSKDGILGLLKAVLIGSVYTIDDYFDEDGQPMKVVPAEDIEHVVSEVSRRWGAPAFRPWKSVSDSSGTVCACPPPKAKFPRGWSRPQCAVHPDGDE